MMTPEELNTLAYWRRLAHAKRNDVFFGAIGYGLALGGFVMMFVIATWTGPVVDPTLGCSAPAVNINEYKQVVKSLDQCNHDMFWYIEEYQSAERDNAAYYDLQNLSLAVDAKSAEEYTKRMTNVQKVCDACREPVETSLYDCYFHRDNYCWCPDNEDAPQMLSTHEVSYEELYETAVAFCTYMEEELRESEGSLWGLMCPGIQGRTLSDFDAFFGYPAADRPCPDDRVCQCKD